MAAGDQYPKGLNSDSALIKTPAFYDENLDEWLMSSANVVKTEGGVFIFQKGTDDGRAKVEAQLTGSNVEQALGSAIPSKAILAGGSDGTNIRALNVTEDGSLVVSGIELTASNVDISGSFDTIRPMIGATKTATSVASEAFAGASRLAGRRGLLIKNENWAIRLHLDGSAITAKTGVAIEPFGVAAVSFDPAVDVPIYVISEAGNISYGVVEW